VCAGSGSGVSEVGDELLVLGHELTGQVALRFPIGTRGGKLRGGILGVRLLASGAPEVFVCELRARGDELSVPLGEALLQA
jgi:hypothetical protein